MEQPLPNHKSYKELTLVALLSLLITTTAEAESESLKTELYYRLQAKFLDRCHKIAFKLYRGIPHWDHVRDEVFQETFIIAMDQIQSFKIKENWTDEECEKVLLHWMSNIANKLFLNEAKRSKKEAKLYNDYGAFLEIENSSGEVGKRKNYSPTYDKAKFDALWEKLNPMSKELLLLCADNGTLNEENSQHLPDEIINRLTQKYGVKPAALRKAKQRALQALENCKLDK